MNNCTKKIGLLIKHVLLLELAALFFLHTALASVGNYLTDLQKSVHDTESCDLSKKLSEKLNFSIQTLLSQKNTSGLLLLADSLKKSIDISHPDSALTADIYYYSGVCELLAGKYDNAVHCLKISVEMKKKLKTTDKILLKGLYNIGVTYNYIGDLDQVTSYIEDYISYAAILAGENSSDVAEGYSVLVGTSIEKHEYDDFIKYSLKALDILKKNKDALDGIDLFNLYQRIGTGYSNLGDVSKGRIYLEEAESIFKKCRLLPDYNYINLVNSLAITYGNLGLTNKEEVYFEKGIKLASSSNSTLAFNIINSYAIGLGNSGKTKNGETLLKELVDKAKSLYGKNSRYYIEVLKDYSDYLLRFSNNPHNSLNIYSECIDYMNHHKGDKYLRNFIIKGYAEALYWNGEPIEALRQVQELLFNYGHSVVIDNLFINPVADSLNADKNTLNLLHLKYDIIWSLYSASSDLKVLEAAASTSELMISLVDKMRLNISEDESRIVLGDRYRNSYLLAIRDFELCYRKTADPVFLEKAFKFAEKSKVAGLLTATRELNAIQFQIPENEASLEKSLQREIGFYNSKISLENDKEEPDLNLITELKEKLLSVIKERDSLVFIFEKDYPGYYNLKYSTSIPAINQIPSIIGRNNNYLNYVVSDSMLYIFLVNRKNKELVSCKVDSAFTGRLRKFRALLSDPSVSANARTKFDKFRETGYDLCKTLIEPVRKYFISDNLIISPDNLLSYLPFETLLSSKEEGNDLNYRDLKYLMNDYRISYTYSATFMKETVRRSYPSMKNLVAFAPVYPKAINADSLMLGRQTGSGFLFDLPEARIEAEYVSELTGGKLYMFNNAKESTFKKVAGNYSIIHLAMHTLLNDQNPMNSAMIFDQSGDSPDDGLLYTYEVFGLPLNARMVVLSSCNTGNGVLSSGEGILSLARGFLYSGSRSVVMSMWNIDDKSGTDVVKMFYDNLKRGKSKSQALKSARTAYLRNASQLRSHPYFWASLVVYGDNDPVYTSFKLPFLILFTILLISGAVFLYLRKRRYS